MIKIILLTFFLLAINFLANADVKSQSSKINAKPAYWLQLYRKSNIELLYFGEGGNVNNSYLVKTFKVKSGILGEKPTPLPKLLGREYWLITEKVESFDNPETAPYFLALDVPVTDEEPFGPPSYNECNGQCNWQIPGYFGLHGVNGDLSKLSNENAGSSGCVRHKDEDITYLYYLLEPEKLKIRYYVSD